jgi:hypothetical protein
LKKTHPFLIPEMEDEGVAEMEDMEFLSLLSSTRESKSLQHSSGKAGCTGGTGSDHRGGGPTTTTRGPLKDSIVLLILLIVGLAACR